MRQWVFAAVVVFAGCGGGDTGSVQFTASGEVLVLNGYRFPPANPGDPHFVDGWDVSFSKLFAAFDRVVLSPGPDTSASDQSQVGGKPVAEIDGPWAVDLQGRTPSGKGGW